MLKVSVPFVRVLKEFAEPVLEGVRSPPRATTARGRTLPLFGCAWKGPANGEGNFRSSIVTHDLDGDGVTFLHKIPHVSNIAVGDLRNMHKPYLTSGQFDKRPERYNPRYGTLQNLPHPNLGVGQDLTDSFTSLVWMGQEAG